MRITMLQFCLLFLSVWCRAQVFTSSNLPILIINTNGQDIVDEPKINCDMKLVYGGPGVRNYVTGPFSGYDGRVGIELRGSSSQDLYAKKGYGIELRDAAGLDREESLLDMPKESDWVLIGPYNDKTLMRDVLAQRLASEIMTYAPRMRLIEMVLNGKYEGVYVLGEKIKRGKDRVNISKNEQNNVTGGYILKLDKVTGVNSEGWQSPHPPTGAAHQRTDILFHYPTANKLKPNQEQYITQHINQFESVLAGPQFLHPTNGYRRFINMESFIDYMLINEAVRNLDAYRLSTFFYKDRDDIDGRIHMGPVWDFNIAFGIGDYCEAHNTQGWVWNHHIYCPQDEWLVPFWWERFRQDPSFMLAAAARWKELRAGTLSDAHTNYLIDSLSSLLQESRVRNFQRWPVMGQYIWPNAFVGQNYNAEVTYLRNWFRDRLKWMDGAFDAISDTIGYEADRFGQVVLYPNPVRESQFQTRIYAKSGDRVRLKIYDMLGRLVHIESATLTNSGEQEFTWPSPESGGIYEAQIWIENELVRATHFIRL